jgi:transcriptional regulator with XRE-family HTH domain
VPSKSDKRKAATLKKTLKEQGHSTTWLAETTGYNRSYVSNMVNGNTPMTEAFQQAVAEALKTAADVPVLYRGRRVLVPENIYKNAAGLPPIVVESVYEEAWKRSWLAEHAATTLAVAADRAWQAESALSAA